MLNRDVDRWLLAAAHGRNGTQRRPEREAGFLRVCLIRAVIVKDLEHMEGRNGEVREGHVHTGFNVSV